MSFTAMDFTRPVVKKCGNSHCRGETYIGTTQADLIPFMPDYQHAIPHEMTERPSTHICAYLKLQGDQLNCCLYLADFRRHYLAVLDAFSGRKTLGPIYIIKEPVSCSLLREDSYQINNDTGPTKKSYGWIYFTVISKQAKFLHQPFSIFTARHTKQPHAIHKSRHRVCVLQTPGKGFAWLSVGNAYVQRGIQISWNISNVVMQTTSLISRRHFSMAISVSFLRFHERIRPFSVGWNWLWTTTFPFHSAKIVIHATIRIFPPFRLIVRSAMLPRLLVECERRSSRCFPTVMVLRWMDGVLLATTLLSYL